MMNYYKAGRIFYNNVMVEDRYLQVEDGKFIGLTDELPETADFVDYSAYLLAPGLVDTHIHGMMGHDVMDNDLEGLQVIAESLLSTGVTSWLPTTLTDSDEKIDSVCRMIGQHYQDIQGAKIQGIFLEGPFFTEEHKGAQNPKYMSDPSIEILARWQESSEGLVRKIAIAPERNHVKEFIRYAKSQGIYVALAHSNASYAQASQAVAWGASIFVHTYNGMSGLHHREPGMVGAAMTLADVYAEIICDGHHVHPSAVKALYKARSDQDIVLITDSMRSGGLGDGISSLGEFEVMVKDGVARLTESGNLAGSILQQHIAVKNMIDWGICSLESALKMASYIPAKSVGLAEVCGKIDAGYAADFVVFDEDLAVVSTYLDGNLAYQK